MKTSKAPSQASTQEECGVWLDTVDLKEKAKQRRPLRPISKQLNPLARSGGYSLAVALNFTQTKIQIPVNKQSSISSFFTPQHKVAQKEPASPEPSTPSTSTRCFSTSLRRVNIGSGTKRKRLESGAQSTGAQPTTLQMSPEGENSAGCEWNRQSFRERAYWEVSHMPHLKMDRQSEEMEEPDKKRRLSVNSSPPVETDTHEEECSPDQWSTCNRPQYSEDLSEPDSEGQCVLTHQELFVGVRQAGDSGTAFPEILQSEGGFRAWLGAQDRTSTQKRAVPSHLISQQVEGKENDLPRSMSSPSPNKMSPPLSPVSTHRWTKPHLPSPQIHVLEQSMKHVLEQPLRECEGDTLAMLFTQDSEGLRVIAHRALVSRSPIKDQTNVLASGRDSIFATDKTLLGEELLFTQDSQGNKVIKH
ncbi:aurora kinase A and ninein-interacting protein [Oncorhynchus tshawytscha]|uniref:aurora kinase A and ninein-interacting protein n=1 Tax=Oncorhynchus tshawytscha TaxID=74940 RepID=UPI000D0A0AA5|nr:aurora kinase A and ninein-interacting protein [Oncorhynchus tshawytscha]XP_024296697.1 aurora kinase A and ninein-interacting protein [Oncorhynchus tshawytscha]